MPLTGWPRPAGLCRCPGRGPELDGRCQHRQPAGAGPQPDGATLDVTSDPLLAAAAARANITGSAASLPAGRSLYGYWVSGSLLNSLLGDGAAEALQNASWDEWSDFVETLQDWLAEPKAATVTLNGADRTLPEARPEVLTATGVFAPPLDRTSGYTVAVLAADGQYTANALTGR